MVIKAEYDHFIWCSQYFNLRQFPTGIILQLYVSKEMNKKEK